MVHELLPTTIPSSISDLPYDVLLHILRFLSSVDLVRLLSCSRSLYALVQEEPIWRSLSALYGLHDIEHFGGRSWYTVYARLLRPYGPMLGLWAGDHPYTGGVLDVRLHPGDRHTPGGIVIDMWQFRLLQPEDLDGPERPELPIRTPLVRIDFSTASTPYEAPFVRCCCNKRLVPPPHPASIEVLSDSYQGHFLRTRHGSYSHPDFPSSQSHGWLDESRYPLLRCRPSPVEDQTPQVSQLRPRIPMVFTAPTTYRKAKAISIHCGHGCVARIRPFLGFDDVVPTPPRYYPLRLDVHPEVHPVSREWHPRLLVGLWLGSHGPHGTECLYFDWDSSSSMLRAWKITGDENVPRGALSWEVSTRDPYPMSQVPPSALEQGVDDLARYRLFGGTGTISARGYLPHQTQSTAVVLAVGAPDTLQVMWIEMDECSAYIRYKRRGG
ncbi:hypothetical protein L226DRAFT_468594 [Lentinus tigrinus ALCF2SS1-7]|uniref:F-box domain-containing protein n=1 Tax=Lentinus tigrinus ALCF2SS1-6 TaxID=1328759 RepID=A0A5C2RZ85_9APHY|nr:hypothetical protein L227DRAFT_508459 [Lentinus tigrinus ALCF2SS1-6]RPD71481.1 hypothetical protein L226DRAFT_468594 [Lentinus tigrinus ALCF2SS1-7]